MPRARRTKSKKTKKSSTNYDTTEAPSDLARYAIDVIRKTDKVIRFFNTEDKMFDSTQSTAPDTSGIVIGLSFIRQGTAWNQRIGNSIRLLKWVFRASLKSHPTPVTTTARMIVFSDMNNNGVFPSVAEVLEAANPWSPYQHSFLQRFAVLSDRMFPISQQGDPNFAVEIEEPTNFHVYYEGDSGTNSMYRNNNLFILLISDQPGATAPVWTSYSRLHYVDD
jgi:hypothetical protein